MIRILLICLAIYLSSLSNGFVIPELVEKTSNKIDMSFIFNGTDVSRIPAHELNSAYWHQNAHEALKGRLQGLNKNKAKNVIFFLGDGMSLSTQMAARLHKGQLKGQPGEEEQLNFEKFPHAGLIKTYCTDAQTPDSACTSTAYSCGVKANSFTLGVAPNVLRFDCNASMNPANQLSSIAEWAQKAGKSTGFITTTTLTHASPAGLYGHSAFRLWESDREITSMGYDAGTCMDLAQQLLTQSPGKNFQVMMGGGSNKLLPNTTIDAFGNPGHRRDGKNLIDQWLKENPHAKVITDRKQLLNLDTQHVGKVMGIFNTDLMDFHVNADRQTKPSLVEMTETALKLLARNDNGYFVFIEGGRIDGAHHANQLQIAVDETLELEKAVQVALEQTDPGETLIVVSADHGHPLTISGYGLRGDDVFDVNPRSKDLDMLPFFNANYAFGTTQYREKSGQPVDLSKLRQNYSSEYPGHIRTMGSHSADDVGVFAHGPYAHLFTGVMEQHWLPHWMAYAACIGDGPKMCDTEAH